MFASSCCLGAPAVSAPLSASYDRPSFRWPGVGSMQGLCQLVVQTSGKGMCLHTLQPPAVPCRDLTACTACVANVSTLWRHAANTTLWRGAVNNQHGWLLLLATLAQAHIVLVCWCTMPRPPNKGSSALTGTLGRCGPVDGCSTVSNKDMLTPCCQVIVHVPHTSSDHQGWWVSAHCGWSCWFFLRPLECRGLFETS